MVFYVKSLLYIFGSIVVGMGGLTTYFIYSPFYLPKPTGKFAVGICEYHWIDTSRLEARTTDSAHPHRELMVKAWYPTEMPATGLQASPYATALLDFDRKSNKTITQKINLLLSGFERPIYAYYTRQAPIARVDQPFPIIIFSHGFGVPDVLYTTRCAELASHGYIIFSINHTFDCVFVDFPDGRRLMQIPSPAMESILEETKWLDTHIETWVSDVQFVLNQITKESQDDKSRFYSKLDLTHIGMFGHSLGGSAAIQCCRRDERLRAGCSLDGYLRGPNFAKSFNKPFMFMRAMAGINDQIKSISTVFKPIEQSEAKKYLAERVLSGLNEFAKKMGSNAYIVNLEQAYHDTFTDLTILKYAGPYPHKFNYMGTGSYNGYSMTHTINSYLVTFFDMYLKSIPETILEPYKADKTEEPPYL
jgi:Predicted dienelactone hydrolase